ncbi:MAG: 50S ribosomal protein L2 [Opitutales bacterium]|tara:strand:+ start:240 stop:1088 length:849 start_codon:yes stop_codon:yes gene_type:complete
MALKKHRPLTPGQRFFVSNNPEVSKKDSERRLTQSKHRAKGRNCYGRITSRRRGGGHKRNYRIIDFKRNKFEIPAKVQAIEYDPNRSANIALLAYCDGEKRYILAPIGVKIGDVLVNTNQPVDEYKVGYSMPLKLIPPATTLHAIELLPGKGAQIARGAGVSAQLVSIEGDKATLKMPSGEVRLVNSNCRATIGVVGNANHQNATVGKAGRSRWKGRRPRVRGVAMNPVDHPMGGGEGRTSGGGHPVSPWGQLSKGYPTRVKSKPSNSLILVRRNGRKLKKN